MIDLSLRRLSRFTLMLATAGFIAFGGCASIRVHKTVHNTAPSSVEVQPAAAPAPVATAPSAPVVTVSTTGIDAAPANIRNFTPAESGIALNIPAEDVDMRALFEELGEDTTLWFQHVQTLANPFFGGRQPGTRGDEIAAEYIEFYFNLYGLEPAFPAPSQQMGAESMVSWSSFRQHFDFPSPDPEVRIIEATGSMNGQPLADGTDFVLLGNSGNGRVTGPVTFVGYGIAEGPDGYTSFEENKDLSGRIAMVLRYEPLNEEGKSQWSTARFSQHSGIAAKMNAVAERGAAAIILVNPPGAVDGKTELETIESSRRFGTRLDIPVVQVSNAVADQMLAIGDTEKRNLLTWRQLADKGEIKTADLDASLQVSIVSSLEVNDRMHTHNVAAVLRGRGSLSEEWIVIGGHYDHVGYGYTGVLPQNVGYLHPGGDDNASGTAGVLLAAKRMSATYANAGEDANLRSVVFIGFAGEEAGLHGSRYFVENPPMSLGAINIMFNMDMIGRLRSNNLMIQGTGTAEQFDEELTPILKQSGLKISASPGGRGPSDHSNFYSKDIPVLFFFTGTHDDYHRPTDHAHTLNPSGGMKIVGLLEKVAMHFATMPERLRFAASTSGTTPRNVGSRVTLGTMPDYTAELETGIRVDGVREGSSADEAGVKAGDILLTWNGEELTGPARLAEFLNRHSPGDEVKVILRRDATEMTVNVRLKGRSAE